MPEILDKELYNKAREITNKKYGTHTSAYRSAFLVMQYKKMGGRYADDGKQAKLKRWFKEKWHDVGHKSYPVFRPSVRITKDTPLTINEIDKNNLQKQINLKQKIKGSKNLPPFKKKI